jgi:uncharacterized membrane protein YbhN (UPF0104 family)
VINKLIISPESYVLVVLIIFCVVVHFLIEPIRWSIYLRKSDKQSLLNLLYIFSSTAFFSYILPAKMGLPFRFWLISKFQGVKKTITGMFMAIDSALVMTMWTSASLIFSGEFVLRIINKNLDKYKWITSNQMVILGGLFCLFFGIYAWKKRHHLHNKVLTGLNHFNYWHLPVLISFLMLDICSYVVRHIFIIKMLPIEPISCWNIATISIVSVFAGFVSTMPMGLVGYDATIIFFLNKQGVSVEIAILVPLINRAANIVVSMMMGIPSAFKLGIGMNIKKLKRKVGSTENE